VTGVLPVAETMERAMPFRDFRRRVTSTLQRDAGRTSP